MLPFYKIVVNEDDETGVDFNSFVDYPAHMKDFIAFGKETTVKYHFDKDAEGEKRIVTGVMISAGTPIYRKDETFGEHYVIFNAETIDLIRRKFFSNGFNSNVNIMHDENQIVKGAVLVDSYLVDNSDPKKPNIPEVFEKLKLQNGSWIASYYIKDDSLWQEVKSGKFGGFSVEGWFDKVQINVKSNNNKMSKSTKTLGELFHSIFGKSEGSEKFAQATSADGSVLMYDGELAVGTQLFIEADGQQVPAPEGDHQLTLEDGSVKIVMLDGSGVVLEMQDFEAEESNEESLTKEEVAEFMADLFTKNAEATKKAIEDEVAPLKAELEALKSGGKFSAQPLKVNNNEPNKITAKDLLKGGK